MGDVERVCGKCALGERFTPRPDEIERYGEAVMGCKRRNWEGYTRPDATCGAFMPTAPPPSAQEPRP